MIGSLHFDRFRVNQEMCRLGPDRLGYLKAWYLSRLKLRFPWLTPKEFTLRLTECGRVLSLPVRYNTDDAVVLRGIFADREYETDEIPKNIRTVLDLGGNCGFGLAYLSARFPDAEFATVEPDPRNLGQLRRTIRLNNLRATIVPAAIGPQREMLDIAFDDERPSCNRAASDRTGWLVPAVTIAGVLQSMNWSAVDLIKMDIEGMEHGIVTQAGEQLQRARFILFELHPWVSGEDVIEGLKTLNFEVKQIHHKGEQVYLAVNRSAPVPS